MCWPGIRAPAGSHVDNVDNCFLHGPHDPRHARGLFSVGGFVDNVDHVPIKLKSLAYNVVFSLHTRLYTVFKLNTFLLFIVHIVHKAHFPYGSAWTIKAARVTHNLVHAIHKM